tara:strand:+ start:46618 stop:47745 length:1128 start_codon:yes stop_codon:yes gene_type:complete
VDHIIIDTNYFYRDPELEHAAWRNLVALHQAGDVIICVPEIVIREQIRHRREAAHREISEGLEGLAKSTRSLVKNGLQVEVTDLSELRGQRDALLSNLDYEDKFRDRLQSVPVAVLGFPSVDSEELFVASHTPKKPFKANERGLADYLIWRSVVERQSMIASGDKVIFATRNHRDFADGGHLHGDLSSDIDPARFELHADPDAYLKSRQAIAALSSEFQAHHLHAFDEYETTSATQTAIAAAWSFVFSSMQYQNAGSDYWDGDIDGYLPSEFDGPTFDSVDLDERTATWAPYDDVSGTVLGRLTVEADAVVDAYVSKSETFELADSVTVSNFDHNRHMSEVSYELRVKIDFHVRLDGGEAQVLNVESIAVVAAND